MAVQQKQTFSPCLHIVFVYISVSAEYTCLNKYYTISMKLKNNIFQNISICVFPKNGFPNKIGIQETLLKAITAVYCSEEKLKLIILLFKNIF